MELDTLKGPLLGVDKALWQDEVKGIREFYQKFGDKAAETALPGTGRAGGPADIRSIIPVEGRLRRPSFYSQNPLARRVVQKPMAINEIKTPFAIMKVRCQLHKEYRGRAFRWD